MHQDKKKQFKTSFSQTGMLCATGDKFLLCTWRRSFGIVHVRYQLICFDF